MNYYCSNALVTEVEIQLPKLWEARNAEALEFLKAHITEWETVKSIDGQIECSPEILTSKDQRIKVEFKYTEVTVYINDEPRIRETRWLNLIEKCRMCVSYPNPYLRIDNQIVRELIHIVAAPNPDVVKRAVVHLLKPVFIEEDVIAELQVDIPMQDQLTDAILDSNYTYHL